MVRGVARDDKEIRALLLQSTRHLYEDGQRVLTRALDQRGNARGNLRVAVDENADVIAVVARWRCGDQAAQEFDGRLGSHSADDAGGFLARAHE
jgi:hypothetical protein